MTTTRPAAPKQPASFENALAAGLDLARELDAQDALRNRRDLFAIPEGPGGEPVAYFCGNSLGLMPRSVRPALEQELKDWAELAVEAHFHGKHPWYSAHEVFRESGARLVGAKPGEVVMMNSLTVNLHMLMASFYRPTRDRFRILIEDGAFPSDDYAVCSQARFHGFDPLDSILRIGPRPGEATIREEDIETMLDEQGESVALVLLGGVNYATGQLFDLRRVTKAAHRSGAMCGFDLAHAAGNVDVRLHESGADFAAWCSYKYLNSGPGAVAGAFVHEKHWSAPLPRFEGWWGTNTKTRFRMERGFDPGLGAEAWQVSNPPILAMAPLRESLAIFDEAGMPALRKKSLWLHAYTRSLVEEVSRERFGGRLRVITPEADAAHGCQLSIRVEGDGAARALQQALLKKGVVADFREPNILRIAPVPLYNTFADCLRFATLLASLA